jgi:hypothetical protein
MEVQMFRWLKLTVTVLLLLGGGFICAQARGGRISLEDRWNPQHIAGLPVEIGNAIAPYVRVCGGSLAAEHSFVRYFQSGTAKLIGLHFEHLRCANRAALCTAAGCLHQVYISTGGRYRLLRSSYVPELDCPLMPRMRSPAMSAQQPLSAEGDINQNIRVVSNLIHPVRAFPAI